MPMKYLFSSWQTWALLSAAFAALTAIFAKIGIENVNSDFATFVRTVVILLAIGLMLFLTGNWQAPATVAGKSWLFLVLSGLATGASWLCYFRALKMGNAAQVAPVDKLSVVLVAIFAVLFLGERFVAGPLAWRLHGRLRRGAPGDEDLKLKFWNRASHLKSLLCYPGLHDCTVKYLRVVLWFRIPISSSGRRSGKNGAGSSLLAWR